MTPTHHNPNKVLLGSTQSSDREITCENGDPATFPAGVAVRRASDGGLSLASGALIGISAGRSLSEVAKTAVIRAGLRVPLRLTDDSVASSLVVGDLTFTAKKGGADGDNITIALVDDATAGDETVDVVGEDIVIHMEDGASTAQQIYDAIQASEAALELIDVEISGTAGDPQSAAAEAPLTGGVDGFAYVVKGAAVEVDSSTGLAVDSGSATGAVYVSGVMMGVDPITKAEVPVALVDMPGGL